MSVRVPLAGGYALDDDPDRVDRDALVAFLATHAYWGRWRGRSEIERQVASAWRVVAAYDGTGAMVGFARAVSDGVASAYLADVYVEPEHRGRGLGVAIVGEIVEGAGAADFRWTLNTMDAHGLYERFGFAAPGPDLLERPAPPSRRPNVAPG